MSILVIAEHDNINLKAGTLNTLAAAQQLSGDVDLFIAGNNHGDVINEAKTIDGLNQIISVDSEIYNNFLAEDIANIVASLESEYDYFLAPSSTFGKNFMPRVAAKIDTQMISDIIEILSEDTYKRPIYAVVKRCYSDLHAFGRGYSYQVDVDFDGDLCKGLPAYYLVEKLNKDE